LTGRRDRGARWDQSLAKLFTRSGWTQEELAKAERVNQKTISRLLLFGRFLNFRPDGLNAEIPTFSLTEGRFRSYWRRTDKGETNERIRLGPMSMPEIAHAGAAGVADWGSGGAVSAVSGTDGAGSSALPALVRRGA
jgi:hypothetical protein